MALFKNLFALILTLFILLIPTSLFLVKFDNRTPFGKIFKRQFIRYPTLVELANLNEPGDLRYLYLKNSLPKLTVNLISVDSVTPHPQSMDWITQMIADTTGKSADFNTDSPSLPELDAYSDADLNQIRSQIITSHPTEPFVNIVYLSTYADKPSYAGLVIHSDTIFVFKTGLDDLTSNQVERAKLEQSTLMHEWGHLLGLEHTDLPDCIMASSVDVFEGASAWRNVIPTTYCWTELDNLSSIKSEATIR